MSVYKPTMRQLCLDMLTLLRRRQLHRPDLFVGCDCKSGTRCLGCELRKWQAWLEESSK